MGTTVVLVDVGVFVLVGAVGHVGHDVEVAGGTGAVVVAVELPVPEVVGLDTAGLPDVVDVAELVVDELLVDGTTDGAPGTPGAEVGFGADVGRCGSTNAEDDGTGTDAAGTKRPEGRAVGPFGGTA